MAAHSLDPKHSRVKFSMFWLVACFLLVSFSFVLFVHLLSFCFVLFCFALFGFFFNTMIKLNLSGGRIFISPTSICLCACLHFQEHSHVKVNHRWHLVC